MWRDVFRVSACKEPTRRVWASGLGARGKGSPLPVASLLRTHPGFYSGAGSTPLIDSWAYPVRDRPRVSGKLAAGEEIQSAIITNA